MKSRMLNPSRDRRFRRMLLEALEDRACPAFVAGWIAGTPPTLTFTGSPQKTTNYGFGFQSFQTGNDILDGIYIGTNGDIWFDTNSSKGATDTGRKLTVPINIVIKGLSGDDQVLLGNKSKHPNLPGFAYGTVVSLKFTGGAGDDDFNSPSGVVVRGATPNITFIGGDGYDRLFGGSDADYFEGGNYSDWADGGGGNDILISGPGNKDFIATFNGGPGNDTIVGGPLGDKLVGGVGNDNIDGRGGNDIINGGAGDDTLSGGDGNDFIDGGPEDDIIDTGPGGTPGLEPDGSSGGPWTEVVHGGDGSDSIDAEVASGPVYLDGGDGQDTIVGSDYDDEIHGGPRTDWLYGEAGDDKISGDGGDDWIFGWAGNDTIDGGPDNDTIEGGTENDTITGGGGDDIIWSGTSQAVAGPVDQPYNGVGPNPTWHDMAGSGGGGNDLVDGHNEPGPDGAGYYRRPTAIDDLMYVHQSPFIVFAPGVIGNDPPQAFGAHVFLNVQHGQLSFDEDNGSFVYVPDSGFEGDDSFTYVSTDGTSISNEATVTLRVSIPPAVPRSSRPPGGGTFVAPPSGSQLVVSAPGLLGDSEGFDEVELDGSGTSHGQLTLNADGSFSYTPNVGFTGQDYFQFTAIDSSTGDTVGPIDVEIDVPDYLTQAFDEERDAAPDRTLFGGSVLANDDWADQAYLGVGPIHGTATVNLDGTFTYQPGTGFSGDDYFYYDARSSITGQTWPAKVTIHVSAVNAGDDSYPMPTSATSLTIGADLGVLANDNGADAAELIEDDGPAFGTVTLNADGSFTYTPTVAFVGTDYFSYYAIDSATGARSVPINVSINIGPHAEPDEFSLTSGTSLNVTETSILANDTLADGIAVVDGAGPEHGTLTQNADGSLTYTPNATFFGDDAFQYVATDSVTGEQSPPAIITIHVMRAVALPDTYTMDGAIGTLSASAPGVRSNDVGAAYAVLYSDLANNSGTLHLNSNGSITYTPNSNFTGTDTFQYRARTLEGNYSEPATVTINVIRPPHARDDEYSFYNGMSYYPILSPNSGGCEAPGVLGNDIGVDRAQWLENGAHGVACLYADGLLIYHPNPYYIGDDHFRYIAINSLTGEQSIATVTMHVLGPVAVDDEYTMYQYDELNVINSYYTQPYVLENDFGTSTGYARVVTQPLYGTLIFGEYGFSYDAADGFVGDVTFEYQASAWNGSEYIWSNTATVTIHVLPHDPW